MPIQLTHEEQQKLLEYTKRHRLPTHKDSLKLQAGNSEEPADLISWCVKDILIKLELDSYYKGLAEIKKANLQKNITLKLINKVVDFFDPIINSDKKLKIQLAKVGKKIENIEELMYLVNVVIFNLPNLKDITTTKIKEAYSELCREFSFEANLDIIFSY